MFLMPQNSKIIMIQCSQHAHLLILFNPIWRDAEDGQKQTMAGSPGKDDQK